MPRPQPVVWASSVALLCLLAWWGSGRHGGQPEQPRRMGAGLLAGCAAGGGCAHQRQQQAALELQLLAIPSLDMDGLACLDIVLASHTRLPREQRNGSSPPDLEAELQRDGAPRTLFFVPLSYLESGMDRHLFHTYCGALAASNRDPDRVAIWGPGWPGWDYGLRAAANVRSHFGEQPFGLVVSLHHLPEEVGLEGSPVYLTYRFECVYFEHGRDEADRYKCWIQQKNRYPWHWSNVTLLSYDSNILEMNEESERNLTGAFDGQPGGLVAFWPHTNLPGAFFRRLAGPIDARPYDICLLGKTSDWYPLRSRLAEWWEQGLFEEHGLRSQLLPHFGYTEELSDWDRQQRGINAASLERQYERYIDFLFQCKAAFATSSFRHVELKKYSETAMASALMVGNVPNSSYGATWSRLIVDIGEDAMAGRVEAVMGTIKLWLSEGMRVERELKIRQARLLAFSQRTSQHGWRRMLEAYHLFKGGRRGFVLPRWLEPQAERAH